MWHSAKQTLGLSMPEARQEDPCYSVDGREGEMGNRTREEERRVIIPQDA